MATICCTNPNATLSLTCPDPWTYCSSGTVCPNAYAWYDVCTMQVWVWVVIAIVSFIFIALVISTIFCVYHCGKRRAAEAMMEARVTTRGGEQLLLAKPGRPGAVLAEIFLQQHLIDGFVLGHQNGNPRQGPVGRGRCRNFSS